ncbi:GatB/YqeY domain-containing protein [candidate division KSB1 bacterium]|nr:GatB/YqeY domain-containing protein [candidate division KSB1 bacterium]
MGLEEKLSTDLKAAMKSSNKAVVDTLRIIRAAIQNVRLDKKEDLSEEEVLSVISKEAKKRKESIELYEKGGRTDLVEQESKELEIISAYLPEAMSDEILIPIIDEALQESGVESINEMGKVMALIMPKVKGKADGKHVQDLVKEKLS